MDLKISLVEDSMIPGQWHWTILKWNGDAWCNAGCGLETDFDTAVSESKKYYDLKKGGEQDA